ncbi:exodeoxyribonuclease V subunit alpha [Malikia spinosa]|uniref:exodeoxyribonuclease V subunit alpha n=1 Tax=Malikia spinosa TaxID=86180 RepID=UPI0027B8C850|nr:exodeoxyribonuclease V subunit alpha [Malikia spinosa]
MTDTLHTLHAWADQGWLRRLDSALAAFVQQQDPQAAPAVLVASALLAQMEGRGHSCLPLAKLVQPAAALLGWPDLAQLELQALWSSLPAGLDGWVQALQDCRLVRQALTDEAAGQDEPDLGQPLVLGGTRAAPLLYLRRYWVYEQQVASAITERAARLQPVDRALARQWLDRMFTPQPIEPIEPTDPSQAEPRTDWQKIACALALRSGLTVITGGPGTGKTYTAARLLALLLAMSPDASRLKVALAAPTGKAAARLRQSIDQSLGSLQPSLGNALDLQALTTRIGKASTVHSLLGMQMGSRQFRHDARHPLDLDLLIVDETSMIHLEMMAALLQAMPPHARLVLLGDKDQLASVEAGSVLGDLCAHAAQVRYDAATRDYLLEATGEALPASSARGSALDQQTVMLRHSRRFGTTIGALAREVNAGQAGAAMQLLRQNRDGLVWLAPQPASPEILLQLALQGRPGASASYSDYLLTIQAGPDQVPAQDPTQAAGQESPEQAHADWVKRVLIAFDRFRILCAVHEGEWGDRALNQGVQRALAARRLIRPEGEWFIGRPVMVTRNDKALGIFNGDVGIVLPSASASSSGSKSLRAYFLDGEQLRSVAVSRLAHVETAFAMTIHKSQGSEFAHTVVVLPEVGGEIITRELVYTGITRARECLSIVEPRPGLLGEAIGRQVQRASGLEFRTSKGS